MPTCVDNGRITEADFVRVYCQPERPGELCAGELLTQSFYAAQFSTIVENIISVAVRNILWGGFQPSWAGGLTFRLCGLHWMDIAAAMGNGAHLSGSLTGMSLATQLVHQTACLAGWDQKEIANMFAWQRVQLT